MKANQFVVKIQLLKLLRHIWQPLAPIRFKTRCNGTVKFRTKYLKHKKQTIIFLWQWYGLFVLYKLKKAHPGLLTKDWYVNFLFFYDIN